jgi:hypothetical protein
MRAKQKFKCWLTELKCCREDLVFKKIIIGAWKNLSFTVNYKLSLENNEVFVEWPWIVHHDFFQYIEIIRLISRPGKAGSYKQPLFQQIVHAAFDPLEARRHFPCNSNFQYILYIMSTHNVGHRKCYINRSKWAHGVIKRMQRYLLSCQLYRGVSTNKTIIYFIVS